MRPHLTVEQRQLALRLKAKGLSLWEIGQLPMSGHRRLRWTYRASGGGRLSQICCRVTRGRRIVRSRISCRITTIVRP
jgi:hypothetical protein